MTERRQELGFALVLLLALAACFGLEISFRAYKADETNRAVDWTAMVEAIGEVDPETQRARFVPGGSFGEMHFNSLGLRGPEVPMPQPRDLVRIAFLGDSKVLSAEYSEAQSFSAQVVAQLGLLVPRCRFDYLTVAGPGYTVPIIADLWTEVAPSTSPDLAVVLAGTIGEMTATTWKAGMGPAGQKTWLDALLAKSWLLDAVQSRLYAISIRLAPPPAASFDAATLGATHRANFAPLVDALNDTPVLALGYRGRLRQAQPFEDQARYARYLQFSIPGLTVAEAVELTEINVDEMARIAQDAGWQFSDPIADMPTGKSHFVDNHHFSATGLSDIATRIAALIAAGVGPDCTVARNDAVGQAD